VSSWLRLSTSQQATVDLVAAQDDSMAIGARKAFQEIADASRERWLGLPFLGCDGLPNSGQTWVRKGLLTATIYVPPNAGKAVEMMSEALQIGAIPPDKTLITPVPYPELAALAGMAVGAKAVSAHR
jgi:ribose transport system substrate-binding protein